MKIRINGLEPNDIGLVVVDDPEQPGPNPTGARGVCTLYVREMDFTDYISLLVDIRLRKLGILPPKGEGCHG